MDENVVIICGERRKGKSNAYPRISGVPNIISRDFKREQELKLFGTMFRSMHKESSEDVIDNIINLQKESSKESSKES